MVFRTLILAPLNKDLQRLDLFPSLLYIITILQLFGTPCLQNFIFKEGAMDIHAELKKAICKVNPGINEENITPEATFIGDLEMDSLSMVELSLAMEDSFGITLPDEELAKLTTVGEVTELIESKLGK